MAATHAEVIVTIPRQLHGKVRRARNRAADEGQTDGRHMDG